MKIKEAIQNSKIYLENVTNRWIYEAQILLSHLLQKDIIYLHLNDNLSLDEDIKLKFFELLKRRANFEPIEYLTNSVNFYSNEFYIDNRALIPRPETELLIDEVLKLNNINKVAEIGVGSGIISIMLKKLNQNLKIVATDISKDALEVAKINADKHNAKIEFIHSNLLDFVNEEFDLIVSNPPYIAKDIKLEKNLSFEPQNALFGGEIGDEILKNIIDLAIKKKVKYLACEMGYDQKEKILNYISSNKVTFYKDLAGFNRGFVIKF